MAHDPFGGLVLPKRGLVNTFNLSLQEIRDVIGAATEPYRTFCMILAETGIRGGEICALRVDDFGSGECCDSRSAERVAWQAPDREVP